MKAFLASFDFCSYLVVAIVAHAVARTAQRFLPRFAAVMGWAALVTLVGVCVYGFVLVRPLHAHELFGIVVIAWICACGVALIVAIFLPPIAGIFDAWRHARNQWRLRSAEVERATEREEEEHRKVKDQHERDLKWERERPERERRERESQERAKAEAAAQKCRDTARSECLLYFHLHSPDIGKRFTRKLYDEYVGKFLRDEMAPDDVEKHAAKLMELMQGHLEKSGARVKSIDVAGLSRWFDEQKRTLEAQPIPELSKQAALALLYERYNDLMTKHLEELRP